MTAQRRSQSLLQVPLAISALTGDALAQKGITNSADLATAVPNFQVSSPYGNTMPNFSLRGISVSNEYNANQASPIGVYIDDVYIAARTSHGMGLFDLDRVEVLRGPQGTLFGRNTTGGAINFITRQPILSDNSGYAEAGYGNFNDVRAQAALETTLVQDELGVRVAANYERSDGQFRNVYPGGRDGNAIDTLQGRASLRFRPGNGPLDIKIRGYFGRDLGPQAAIHGVPSARQGLGFFETDENRLGENRTRSWGVAANLAYEISPQVKLTSITSYDGGKQDLTQATDGSPLDLLDVEFKSKTRQFSEELRVNYDGDRLHAVGGAFYGWDRIISDNSFFIDSVIAPGVDGGFMQHYQQERRSYAAYAQGDLTLAKRFVLTLGARYTADRARYEDGYAYLFQGNIGQPPVPIASTVPCATAPGTCAYDSTARFGVAGRSNALTGRAALSYTLDGGTLIYASYNRGYRSGAFNGGGYTSSAGITYVPPEEVNAYEAGLKGRFFDRKLTLSAAAFYYDYRNQQVQESRPGPVSVLVSAPKSQVYGAEAEASFKPLPSLTLNAAFGYDHATYQNLTLQATNLAGNSLPFAPRWTGQAGFEWRLVTAGRDSLTFLPLVTYSSRSYFSPFNSTNVIGGTQINSELQQGPYAKVNAALSWVHDSVIIRAWANNLLQAKTYSYGLDTRGAGLPFNLLIPTAPRTYGMSARASF